MGLIDMAQKMGQSEDQSPVPDQATENQPSEQPGQAEDIHRRLGLAAMKIVYTVPESDHLLEILKNGKDDPATAVAYAAMAVLGRLKREVKGINPDLVYSVAPAVVVFLLEIGGAAKVFEPSVDMIKEALLKLSEITKQQDGAQQSMPAEQPPAAQPMGA